MVKHIAIVDSVPTVDPYGPMSMVDPLPIVDSILIQLHTI